MKTLSGETNEIRLEFPILLKIKNRFFEGNFRLELKDLWTDTEPHKRLNPIGHSGVLLKKPLSLF